MTGLLLLGWLWTRLRDLVSNLIVPASALTLKENT